MSQGTQLPEIEPMRTFVGNDETFKESGKELRDIECLSSSEDKRSTHTPYDVQEKMSFFTPPFGYENTTVPA